MITIIEYNMIKDIKNNNIKIFKYINDDKIIINIDDENADIYNLFLLSKINTDYWNKIIKIINKNIDNFNNNLYYIIMCLNGYNINNINELNNLINDITKLENKYLSGGNNNYLKRYIKYFYK